MFKSYGGSTPLGWAAENGHVAVAKLLLDRGADVNAVNEDNMTPMARAQRGNKVAMVQLLKERGGH